MVRCAFCQRVQDGDHDWSLGAAVAFFDAFPSNDGHVLVIPRRHEPGFFALDAEEQGDLWRLATIVKRSLDASHGPDGYNVGVNAGPAAGQTVDHAHLHLIPRYAGDVVDPRGGVRWVLPGTADYWSPTAVAR